VSYEDDVIFLLDTGLGGLLVRMNLLTQSYVPIPLTNVFHPTTFDYDPVEGRLYFADAVLHQIVSVRFDGTDERLLRQLSVGEYGNRFGKKNNWFQVAFPANNCSF
jgi:hypothetical protein